MKGELSLKKLLMSFFTLLIVLVLGLSNGVIVSADTSAVLNLDKSLASEAVSKNEPTIIEDLDYIKESDYETGVKIEIPFVSINHGTVVETMSQSTYEDKLSTNLISPKAFPGIISWNVVLDTTNGIFKYGYVITGVVGQKPTSMTITVSPQVATTRTGTFSQYGSANFSLKSSDIYIGMSDTKTDAIYSTKYWKFKLESNANWSGSNDPWISYGNNYILLLNKKGVEYPSDYKDPQSGIKLWEPPTDLVASPRSPGNYRDPFMTYYVNNWGAPSKFAWTDVQIHHMRPLKYTGSDATSNLIPLWRPGSTPQNGIMSHSTVNNWWLQY